MRRPLIVVGWIVMAAAIFGINRYFSNLPSPFMARRADIPEPRSIAELRGILKVTAAEPCDFPAVAAATELAMLAGPDDGFAMPAPNQWTRTASGGVGKSFPDDPQVVYRDPAGSRISITRVATGAAGRMYAVDSALNPLPGESCEMVSGAAGTIWELSYDAGRFRAIGEAVTGQGKRYRFDLTTVSAAERHSLAAVISAAVLAR